MRSPSAMLSPEHILQTGFGFRASQTLLSAVEVGLFTELGKGPRSNRQLRRSLGLKQSAVAELLEPLVALGFLEREGDDAGAVYVNSRESGHFLDRNSPGYLGDVLVQSARPEATPQQSSATGLLTIAALLLADRFDFSRYGSMLDLGSTRGLLARALAARHAHLACTRLGFSTLRTTGSLPRADVIVTPMILRRFDEAGRTRLIKRAHQALASGGCLIAIEFLTGEDRRRGSALAALLGVEPQRHRALSWSDLDDSCRAAGFERTELLPLIGPLTATLAYKPPKR
ncbi:methyltransferase dimerization domain-containing protein [Steroidobacter flavus]|uniref:Methyltransferase dimerization domain-containing protein n=1 Tax=Steroidobacter flavus TaxID=1842136 RepID=A0ABV8SQ94_9GAMM